MHKVASSAAGRPTRRRVLGLSLGAALGVGAVTPRPAVAQMPAAGKRSIRIGVLNDQTSIYAAPGGPGSVAAARLAVQEVGGSVLGRPVEILIGDHQNKPDIGAAIAREWLDSGVVAITDGGSSAVALAVQALTREKKRLFLITGSTTTDLTGKACSPTGMQWMTDTYSTSTATVGATMRANPGIKTWFALTADYTFGYDMERYVAAEAERNGGKLIGRARFPLGNADFAAMLLEAQSSGAQALAIGAGGADAVNAIKQAHEFGLSKQMSLAALSLFITDLEGLGPDAEGLIWATTFHWDRNDDCRAWAKRFMAVQNQTPTRIHAGTYSAVLNCLRAIEATGTDDGVPVAAHMRETSLIDPLFNGTRIREDGRVMLPVYLMRAKSAAEMQRANDRAVIVATVAPAQAYRSLADGGCPYIGAKPG